MSDTALPRQPKGFMFDLDGTLILSNRKLGSYQVIPGAVDLLQALEERGIPYLAMTNGSAYPARKQAPRLREVGLPIRDERLFTPNSVAAGVMLERAYSRVMVLGTDGVAEALTEQGVHCCLPGDEAAADADAVYVAWHPDCTMDHIHAACGRILDGAHFLTASDVPFFATKEGRSFGYSCAINGAIARVTGTEPEPTGKPSTDAMRFVAKQLGLDVADVAVVGDDAVAEMQMARAEGAMGIAVTSGSTSREDWAAQPPERSPHLVIEHVGELLSEGYLG
ncbi:4-nitrophenyl phosphatase [Altererythrobacter atlanticus]|uniref:Hydrolase YutF n=1 Tax=Croceibacterium atlanticum TaxID=1267766 RepID=A0A0F7KYC2_9SPHN|nr:HAD family hydrolase [Croceibacterium atlanticum]AKH44222.1 putative hydrolase YutF [Croceibacterium atlanticum]MBB5732533.1 4-nitrophenyl phosphatase [Croceibacterium atlanticum]